MITTVEDAGRQLREAGLRLTPQRRALLEELAGDTSHPAAEIVAARVATRVPGVSLSTVYKGLHELAALGMLRELDVPGAKRFDPDTSPHAHLVCADCGTLVDVSLPTNLTAALDRAVTGAHIARTEVVFHGTCERCSGS
jgi:Fur family peroxide stress response transcriptional regulator